MLARSTPKYIIKLGYTKTFPKVDQYKGEGEEMASRERDGRELERAGRKLERTGEN